jgi:DNA-binding NtrC family response regulator
MADITIPVGTTLKSAEKLIIEATLKHTDGNVSLAAKILDIDRSTLYSKISKYKIPHQGRHEFFNAVAVKVS